MQHAILQSMYVAPRGGRDPRVANSITAERQTANNGILYMLDDPRDVGRYRVMSPAELKRERAVYDDAAATVQRRGGVIATSKRKDKVGPPVGEKIIGPPVGQKARQAQKRAWDEKIKEKKATNLVTATSVVGPISGSSNRSTVGYSMSKPPGSQLVSAYQSMSVSRPVEADRLAASGLNNSELETLKYKYAQNLSVIEQLAAEKEEMARTINALKSGKGMPQETFDGDRAESLTGSDMSLPKYTEEPEGDKFAWKPQQASHRLSAAEASHLFEISPNRERGRTYLRSSNARSTSGSRDPRDRSGFGGTPGSPAGFVRSRSFDAPRRSSSVPRSKANGSTGISYELQADYDRYLQKKRNLQENERRAAQEKEMYEEEQRQRFLRASKKGSEFRGIKERDETINMIRQKRAERVHRQSLTEKEQEIDLEENRKRKYAAAAQSSFGTMNDMGQSFSWRDMEEQEDIRRRERVELRKMELASQVAYPSQEIEQSVEQWKMMKQGNDLKIASNIAGIMQQRRASDPKQVVSKLERQHNLWERRLEREVQTAKASRSHVQVDPSVLEMERRNAEYAERRRVKAIEKDREKMSAEQAHQAKESERIKSLLNAKPPAWKLTKTAEDRARLAKEALEEEVRKQRKEAMIQKKKESRSKEISAFLYSIISQESGSNGRKSEIRVDDNGVPLAVIEKRREDALKAKANRDRISEAVSRRPSLIERHNQQVAQTNARAAGLQKIANAISDCNKTSNKRSSSSGRNNSALSKRKEGEDEDNYADDFFDYEERLELGH